MKCFLIALLALLPTCALAQIPDCSPGLCAGVSVPTFACKSGQKYTQLDAPGTNFSCTGIPPHWVQDGGSSGGATFPLTFIQNIAFVSSSSPVTYTFPHALQASGATAFMIIVNDATSAFVAPTGWTVDFDVISGGGVAATHNQVVLMHKASAGDTTVVIPGGGGAPAGRFFEVSGTHALDQSSTGAIANAQTIPFPAITPTANSVVFAVAGAAMGTYVAPMQAPAMTPAAWAPLDATSAVSSARFLVGFMSTQPATNVSTQPPTVLMPTTGLVGGTGIAYATFSIL